MPKDDVQPLTIGLTIYIRRTNGRVHTAVISEINLEGHFVTVEWFERGEAKGKEVDFVSLFELNEKIQNPLAKAVPEPACENLPPSNVPALAKPESRVPPIRGQVRASHDLDKQRLPAEESNKDYNQNVKKPQQQQLPPPQQTMVAQSVADDQRKSNTVKEIEAIQAKREERRAAQQKAKQTQIQEIDPSNPNFELLKMIRDYQITLDYQTLTINEQVIEQQIMVCVRKRPMNKKELGRREIDVITVPSKDFVIVHEPRVKVDLTKYLEHQHFRFDYAFDDTADNQLVYQYTAKPLVHCIFERGMATCFAYGQTGSGKTHTMGGEFHNKSAQNCRDGIYALAAHDVFHLLYTKYPRTDFEVHVAFFEIYGGKVFDLLNDKQKLRVLEDGKNQVQVVGLRTAPVKSVDEVLQLLEHGTNIRTSGQTSANQHSSRSHAVFQIILLNSGKLHGKFSLIDLAGNERGADTSNADRNTRLEGAEINKSLLALKECIRALGRKGAHLPFRASKLTQVLRDSFIGDRSRTCMIAMISPGKESCEHTLNTLRYADRVKELGPNGEGKTIDDWNNAVASNRGQGTVCTTQQFAGSTVGNKKSAKKPGDVDLDEDEKMLFDEEDIEEEEVQFHLANKKAQKMEDEVCEDYNELCQRMPTWLDRHNQLNRMINKVEYDQETFIESTQKILTEQITQLSRLQDKITSWGKVLKKEDELLTRMSRVRK